MGKSKKAKEKRNKKKKKGLVFLLVLLIILGIAAGIFVHKSELLGGGLKGLIAATLGHDINTKENLDTITFLALGKSQNLTDTIIVCSYNPKTQEAVMLSIPRDTFTGTNKNRATASQKINALYQISPQKTLDAVNKITGLNIKYYAEIDTKSLRQVVDAVGGIYFDVPKDMIYDDTSQNLHINLKKGYQLLNGDQAEQLVRYRHGNNMNETYSPEYGEQDIGRMRTQRNFIIEAAKQTLQFKNIFKLGEIIDIVHENLKTNIPIDLIKDYIPYAIDLDPDSIKSEMLPGEPEKCNGVWLYIHDETASKALIQELFGDKKETEENLDTANIKIEILNGSGNSKKLTQLTNLLKENGYHITKTDTTSNTNKTTIINRTSQSEEMTNKIKQAIGIGNVTTGKSNNSVDYTIIIGKDFNE